MAADVSTVVRVMKGGDLKESKSTAPITRDLLGGCCTLESNEVDLDLQVPTGWEKRLDLKSGKVYIQRCNSSNSSSSTSGNESQLNKTAKFNLAPKCKKSLNLFDDASLDLKLVPSVADSPSSSNYESICTLDKVKSALERAEKQDSTRKRSVSLTKSSSPRSHSSSSLDDEKSSASFATGCPRCLLYVLISESNPRCPQCNTIVPSPMAVKKPRFDLNLSI